MLLSMLSYVSSITEAMSESQLHGKLMKRGGDRNNGEWTVSCWWLSLSG